MKKRLLILPVLVLLFVAYMIWSGSDRMKSDESVYPRYVIGDIEQFGKNTGKGNILALSPYLHTYDFSSQQAFYNMLHYYFDFAKRRNLLNDSTIVILPEYLGSWLVVANEKKSVYTDTSIEEGLQTVALSNLGSFIVADVNSHSKDKRKEAVFKMKAEKMADIYQSVFSKLAKEFHLAIVAGSIVLPDPSVQQGKINIDLTGKLYNVSAVFDANGEVLSPLTKKIFPVDEEKTFTSCAKQNDVPAYQLPAGKLAVLICADAWYPQNYQVLKDKNVKLLAVPSFVSGNDSWSNNWKGYDGAPAPSDINKNDIGTITERAAWLKYAMTGRTSNSTIQTGVNVFLRGDLWNLGSDGHTLISKNDSTVETKISPDKTGSLINVWLE